MNKDSWVIPSVLIASICVASLGFLSDDKVSTITGCEATVNKYMEAEYSESYLTTDLTVETDYFTEIVSHQMRVTTINGELYLDPPFPIAYTTTGLYVARNYPRAFSNIEIAGTNLEYVRERSMYEGRAYFHDGETMNLRERDYLKCVEKIDEEVILGTWYGISSRIKF